MVPKQLFVYHLGQEPMLNHFGPTLCSHADATQAPQAVAAECLEILGETLLKNVLFLHFFSGLDLSSIKPLWVPF